jgi:DNA-binding IclR family transcriptional regulator
MDTTKKNPGALSARQSGTQSIYRASLLLSIVANSGDTGVRLVDVATNARLHIATARRILQVLVSQGFLSFESARKIYTIGPAIFSYAVLGSPWFSRYQTFRPVLDNIAKQTGDTVIFSIRSGNEAVCLTRTEGEHPIRVMTLDVGARRPLGVGSGSLSILAFTPDDDREGIIEQNAAQYAKYGLTTSRIRQMVARTREEGFAFNAGVIVEGVYGLAVPILSRSGGAVASVSVASVAARLTKIRRIEVLKVVREALQTLAGVRLPNVKSSL